MSGAEWQTFSAVLLTICWGVFGVAWLAGAIYNVRHAPRVRERPGRGYGLLAAAVTVVVLSLPIDWGWLSIESPWVRGAGVVVLVASTVFTLWARWELGTMWSSGVVARSGHELRTDGPYSITRHPIYTGMAGMLLGTALMSDLGRWAVIFAFALVFFVIRARSEEQLMSSMFPDYDSYRSRIPQLVPRLSRFGQLTDKGREALNVKSEEQA